MLTDPNLMVLAAERVGDFCTNESVKTFNDYSKGENDKLEFHMVHEPTAKNPDNNFYRVFVSQAVCAFNEEESELIFLAKRYNQRYYADHVSEEDMETSEDYINQTSVDLGGVITQANTLYYTNKIEGANDEFKLVMDPVEYSRTIQEASDAFIKDILPDNPDFTGFVSKEKTQTFAFFADLKVSDEHKTSMYLGRVVYTTDAVMKLFADNPVREDFNYEFISIKLSEIFEEMDLTVSCNHLSQVLHHTKQWRGLDVTSHHLIRTVVQKTLATFFKDLTYKDCYDAVVNKKATTETTD